MAHKILRLPAVKARTGLSRSTIYLRISEGRFPRAISLAGGGIVDSSKAVGWEESRIENWIDQQIKASQKAAR